MPDSTSSGCPLDASTRATYTRIRGVDAFDRVMKNLERLAHLKDDLGVTRPLVSLWFTALQDNVEEVPGLLPSRSGSGRRASTSNASSTMASASRPRNNRCMAGFTTARPS